jgi:multicomponent K+:H+ antiporter subunit E
MRKFFPYPLLTLSLLVLWLLLQQSAGLGHILLGGVIAIFSSRALAALEPEKPYVRKIGAMIRLVGVVTLDIFHSNIAVIGIILQDRRRKPTSGFVAIPLELRDRSGLVILACIITATPGSAWLEYSPTRGVVLIHVLELISEEHWITTVKNRYERLLLEIFQ